MNRLLCFLPLLCWLSALPAQSYDASAGIRVGTDIGLTGQLRVPFIHKSFVLEGILQSSLRRDAGSLTVLGKRHQNVLSRRINIFYGAGFHVGWTDEINPKTLEEYNRPLGVDGIVGAEITFAKFNVSYDFKPAVNVGGNAFPLTLETALSVRYVLSKRNDIWDKQKERATNKRRKKNRREKKREQRRRDRIKAGKDPGGWRFWEKDGA